MTGDTRGPELPGLTFLELLGSGGFSDVFLYERHQPRIKVAVKLMKADVLDDSQRRQFVAEADVMAELAEHPFIVPVIGAGTTDDGRPYMVMRYYPPPDLGERVAASPMSVPDALRTGIQLASAIETAHQAGIIHRDIKPSNVLVSSYDVPGLSDFGIAGRAAEHADDENVGVSMPWSPPEVLTGASNGTVASDVYSLAATVWNIMVGRSPFAIKGGDNSERSMFTRIVHSRPPATGRADVPGSLERLLQQAMSKDPAHRPQSALEFARHLQRVEQELRLARTDIVVLENAPESAPRTAKAPSTPRGAPAQPAGKTQQRPITAPAAPLPPGGQAAQATSRRPMVVAPEVAGPTVPDSAPASAVAQPTTQRPRTVAIGAAGAEQTTRRPLAPSPPALPAEDDPVATGRPWVIWGAAAALLVVIVATGVLLTRGGKSPTVANDLPNDTTQTDAAAVIGGETKPHPPRIKAAVRHGKAIFTWPRDQPGDAYWYEQEGVPGQQSAPSRRIVIPVQPGAQVCVVVHVARGTDATNSSAARACAR